MLAGDAGRDAGPAAATFRCRVRDPRFDPMTGPRLLVHTSVQSIRWGDMDALGHVNNTVYFRYMEQARIEWLFAHAKAHGGYRRGRAR